MMHELPQHSSSTGPLHRQRTSTTRAASASWSTSRANARTISCSRASRSSTISPIAAHVDAIRAPATAPECCCRFRMSSCAARAAKLGFQLPARRVRRRHALPSARRRQAQRVRGDRRATSFATKVSHPRMARCAAIVGSHAAISRGAGCPRFGRSSSDAAPDSRCGRARAQALRHPQAGDQ